MEQARFHHRPPFPCNYWRVHGGRSYCCVPSTAQRHPWTEEFYPEDRHSFCHHFSIQTSAPGFPLAFNFLFVKVATRQACLFMCNSDFFVYVQWRWQSIVLGLGFLIFQFTARYIVSIASWSTGILDFVCFFPEITLLFLSQLDWNSQVESTILGLLMCGQT